jgi:hypothetical protein
MRNFPAVSAGMGLLCVLPSATSAQKTTVQIDTHSIALDCDDVSSGLCTDTYCTRTMVRLAVRVEEGLAKLEFGKPTAQTDADAPEPVIRRIRGKANVRPLTRWAQVRFYRSRLRFRVIRVLGALDREATVVRSAA